MRESRHSGSWEKEKLEVQRVIEAERKAVEGGEAAEAELDLR